jgi:opacity protein-like surface antigen
MRSFRHKLGLVLCGAVLTPLAAFCQETGVYKSDVTVEAFLPVVATTTSYGVQQSTSMSGGVLAEYRYFFGTHSGIEVGYGYSRDTQTYGLGGGPLGVNTNSEEFYAAYVFRFPHKRWSPFLLGGAGGLLFDPRTTAGANIQARAGYLYGGGVDFDIHRRFFARAEYRGFFYDTPTFNLNGLNSVDRFTHLAEPAIGFGYKF